MTFLVSRRHEYIADAGSVKLTGDAEGMITALARVTRLHTMPMRWSKIDEKLLTHPSTLRRIKRLAASAGISEQRTAELLTGSAALPAETYSIPATALPEGKLFNTRYKADLGATFAWAVIVTTAVVAASVAIGIQKAQLRGNSVWLAYSLGLAVTLAVDLALFNFMATRGLPGWSGSCERNSQLGAQTAAVFS